MWQVRRYRAGILSAAVALAMPLGARSEVPAFSGADGAGAIASVIGNTHVLGDLTLATGTLQIELASLSDFATITVDNTLAAGGLLDVRTVNGNTPAYGDRWLIGTAARITGNFTGVNNGYAVQSGGGNVYLAAVPEPTMLGLTGVAAVGISRHKRGTK